MQFTNGLMVSRLGSEPLAAQLSGSTIYLTFIAFFLGCLTCLNAFVSQSYGSKNFARVGLYGWQGLWFALASGGVLLLTVPFARTIFEILGHEETLIQLEVPYFQILMAGSMIALGAKALGNFFMGIQKPIIPVTTAIIGYIVNIGVNYVLIFGHFGFPQLGLVGSAIGVVVGTTCEFVLNFVIFLTSKKLREFEIKKQIKCAPALLKDFIKIGAPAGATFVSDQLLWMVFMVAIIGSFGTEYLASMAIVNQYWRLCFVPASAIAIATTTLVGFYVGAKQFKVAVRRAFAALLLVESLMIGSGVFLLLWKDTMIGWFNSTNDPVVYEITSSFLVFVVLMLAFHAMTLVFLSALRGLKDTFVPSVAQLVTGWGIGIGGALILITANVGGYSAPWIAVVLYMALFGIILFLRFLLKLRKLSQTDAQER